MEREEECGRWKRNKLQKLIEGGKRGEEGERQSRRRRKECTTTFAFCARDASRGRDDAPINRRRDVDRRTCTHTPTPILSISLSLFSSSYLSLLTSRRRLHCVREGGIIEIARCRVQQTRKGRVRGARAPLATDQRRPCAHFPFPHPFPAISWPFIQQDPCSRPTLSFS